MVSLTALAGGNPLTLERLRKAEEATGLPAHDPATGEVLEEAPPLPYLSGEDYRLAPRRNMLVKNLLGAGELSVTYGPPKSGKSFLMTDLSLAVATATADWFGHRIKRSGFVLYLIQEGAGGFPSRLRAWSEHHRRPVPDGFAWVSVRLQFFAEGTGRAAAADVRRVAELVARLEAARGMPCVLIVVDTVARVMTGADENSATDMSRFINQCAVLQDLPSRPHVNVVHHENAGGTKPRGSTALIGAGDAFLRVRAGEEGRSWGVEWAKDDADGKEYGFKLETVELGEDEDGDPVASCVVVQAEAPQREAKEPKAKEGANERIARDALNTAIVDHGEEAPLAPDIPRGIRVARVARWEDAAMRYLPQPETKRKREAFNRAVASLVARGRVRYVDGYAWPTDAGALLVASLKAAHRGGGSNG